METVPFSSASVKLWGSSRWSNSNFPQSLDETSIQAGVFENSGEVERLPLCGHDTGGELDAQGTVEADGPGVGEEAPVIRPVAVLQQGHGAIGVAVLHM